MTPRWVVPQSRNHGQELRAEDHFPTLTGEVQRLLAEAVSGEKHPAFRAIPDGERVHSVDAPEEPVDPVLLVSVYERFRVGVRGELMASSDQILA